MNLHNYFQTICPGVVDTEFIDRMTGIKGIKQQFNDAIGKVLNSEDIAASVIHVLSTPPHVQVSLTLLHIELNFIILVKK